MNQENNINANSITSNTETLYLMMFPFNEETRLPSESRCITIKQDGKCSVVWKSEYDENKET